MKLKKLISIASDAYPDGLIEQYFLKPSGNHGDGLAKFIASELRDTYEPATSTASQLNRAHIVLRNARNELEDVLAALFEKYDALTRKRRLR